MLKRLIGTAVLSLLPSGALRAMEIPADLELQASAASPAALDAAERVQLAATDAAQQGGDAITTIAIVVAALALVYMYFRHQEVMSGH